GVVAGGGCVTGVAVVLPPPQPWPPKKANASKTPARPARTKPRIPCHCIFLFVFRTSHQNKKPIPRSIAWVEKEIGFAGNRNAGRKAALPVVATETVNGTAEPPLTARLAGLTAHVAACGVPVQLRETDPLKPAPGVS